MTLKANCSEAIPKRTIGILALQGCIKPHVEILTSLGVITLEVRNENDLNKVSALILPGGESTTMLYLLKKSNFFKPLQEYCKVNPVWGICAGSILLSKEAMRNNLQQESLDIIPVKANRNFYGPQIDSFNSEVKLPFMNKTVKADFIRAPLLSSLDSSVEELGFNNNIPVLFQHNKCLVCAFHIELTGDPTLHKYFLTL